MLVYQTDVPARGDASGIGPHFAEGDIRKRRFPGAVLADERVNLTGVEVEIDAVDGNDARIELAYPAQPQCGLRRG
jgi:hypothetical protein